MTSTMTSGADAVTDRRSDGAIGGGPVTVVARQSIHDRRGRVVAYELLFRTVGADSATITDADAATAEVLISAFTDIGLDELVGDHRAFVNVPHRFLVDGLCRILPAERVVLEILEDVPVDDEVIAAVRELVDAGYTIALDDFEYRSELRPLVELAHIIKVDVLDRSEEDIAAAVARLEQELGDEPARRPKLLAEKIESTDDLPRLADAGFVLFQGYALDRPQNVEAGQRTFMLQVLAELHRPTIDIPEVVDTISRDPSLAYALLRIVNSAAVNRGTKISSLRHAVVMLGIDALRNWATLLLMTRVAGDSRHAVIPALVRAKVCERLAEAWGVSGPIGFTLGMLSALPTILDEPLAPIVRRLSLDAEMEQALLEREGSLGRILDCIDAYEQADRAALTQLDAPPWLADAALAGLAWAQRIGSLTKPD